VSRVSATPPRLPAEGQVCGLFGVDIVGFTSAQRDDDIRLYLHRELYEILQAAFGGAGLPWQDSPTEDRGDGALIVIPPALPPARVIDPLPERLRSLIRRHNRVFSQPARIQLRAAFHMGPVHYDNHGYVGTDIDILFRLLDAAPLRAC